MLKIILRDFIFVMSVDERIAYGVCSGVLPRIIEKKSEPKKTEIRSSRLNNKFLKVFCQKWQQKEGCT